MRILLVDDNPTNLKLLTKLVDRLEDCEAVSFSSPDQVLSALPELDFDVAIIDYQMPVYNGVELYMEIARFEKYASVPVIFVTANTDQTTRMEALNAGAIDFLTKPVNPVEFQTRVHNIVSLAQARRQLSEQANWLRREVEKAVLQLRQREEEILHRLSLAASYKDPQRASHTRLIAQYAECIARQYGLPEERCRDIALATPIHDVGQVGAPDTALLKQGRLTEAEFRQLQSSSSVGSDLLAGAGSSLLDLAAEIATSHHERWDGQGYPNRLTGEAIPLSGRIVSIAVAFDALTTERPFKSAWSFSRAAEHIAGRAGMHFDPKCVEAFEKASPMIRELYEIDRKERLTESAALAASAIAQKTA